MSNYSVKLPLYHDADDGFYRQNHTLKEVIQQNLKNIILTNPGERIMDSNFGVGLRRFLFENSTETTLAEIDTRIRQQVTRYLPVVKIIDINFNEKQNENISIEGNTIFIELTYKILPLDLEDILSVGLNE